MKSSTNLFLAAATAMAFFAANAAIAQVNHIVTVSNFEFTPASLTIEPGDIVTWTNVEGFHNASGSTSIFPGNPESFSTGSPELAPWSQSVTFTLEGTYNYQCDIHTNMLGTIIVNSSEPPCETPYPAVAGLTSEVLPNGVLIAWDPIAGSIGCQVRVAPKNGSILGTKIIPGSDVSQFFIPGQFLSPGTSYDWQVRCGCSQNPLIVGPWVGSEFSTPAGAVVSSYPNPTGDISNVAFQVSNEGYSSLEVYDMSGRMVHSVFNGTAQPGTDYRFTFSGAHLPPGVYMYRLTTPIETVIEKFMISK
ncbi:MAG TPA: T9SS type A sorting domain-containing protein [Cryomorphaceae bacterium]|nr:T9SS type A sorting domain-containing protein [Cryomorphaceae bacterium]